MTADRAMFEWFKWYRDWRGIISPLSEGFFVVDDLEDGPFCEEGEAGA